MNKSWSSIPNGDIMFAGALATDWRQNITVCLSSFRPVLLFGELSKGMVLGLLKYVTGMLVHGNIRVLSIGLPHVCYPGCADDPTSMHRSASTKNFGRTWNSSFAVIDHSNTWSLRNREHLADFEGENTSKKYYNTRRPLESCSGRIEQHSKGTNSIRLWFDPKAIECMCGSKGRLYNTCTK